MKDYADMSLEELTREYISELDSLKDEFLPAKYRWLRHLNQDSTSVDMMKVRTARGYIMAMRDCGHHIGDLKLLLEYISIKLEG